MKPRRTSLVRGGQREAPPPRALLELCRAGLDSVTFRRKLRAHLGRLVPFVAYCVNTVDPETLIITSSIGDGLSSTAARRLFELEESGRDFNRLTELAGSARKVATLWQATAGDVAKSQRMREVFQALGWCDELRAALVVDQHCWGYLHLFRANEQPPFAAHDVARVERAAPLIAEALCSACLVQTSTVAAAPPAVLLLDERGELFGESAGARGWLDSLGHDVGGSTPHFVHAVGARLRARDSRTSARYRTPGGAWLGLHGSPLAAGAALMLGSPSTRELSTLLFLAHGLTAREREVGELMLRGCANDTIAATLGISLHTAKDHVRAILEKTGSVTRAGFAASLMA